MNILGQLEDISYASFYIVCLIKPSSCSWHISYGENELALIDDIKETYEDDLLDLPLFRVRQQVEIKWLKSSGEEGLQSEIDKLDKELIGYKPSYMINGQKEKFIKYL